MAVTVTVENIRDSRPAVEGSTGKITTKNSRGLRVYLASPFFSDEQIEEVKRLEKALTANPHVAEVFSPMRNQIEELEFGSFEWRQAIFKNDVDHIDWADLRIKQMQAQHGKWATAMQKVSQCSYCKKSREYL